MTQSTYLSFNFPFVESDISLKTANSNIKKIDFQHVVLWDKLMFKQNDPVHNLLETAEIPVMFTLRIRSSTQESEKQYSLYFGSKGILYENTSQQKYSIVEKKPITMINHFDALARYDFLRKVSFIISTVGLVIGTAALIPLAKIYRLNGANAMVGTTPWKVFFLASVVFSAASHALKYYHLHYLVRAHLIWDRMVEIAVKLDQGASDAIDLSKDENSFEFVNKA